jgi:hypothetical protein
MEKDKQQLLDKIKSLIRLAERPGTPAEGVVAREMATKLALKHHVVCKYTKNVQWNAPEPPPIPQQAPPQSKPSTNTKPDLIFYRWIRALASIGWIITQSTDTQVGRQLRFRKPGFNSEVRITQRNFSDGNDFEAEHIMLPDPGPDGKDWSYCTYLTISMKELIQHLDYTKTPTTKWEYATAN